MPPCVRVGCGNHQRTHTREHQVLPLSQEFGRSKGGARGEKEDGEGEGFEGGAEEGGEGG